MRSVPPRGTVWANLRLQEHLCQVTHTLPRGGTDLMSDKPLLLVETPSTRMPLP